MKRILSVFLIAVMILSMYACSKQELADMTLEVQEGYAAIVWEDNKYVPYSAVSKARRGKQIGIVDGDRDDRVYEYKGYSADEWIIHCYVMDCAMLYREIAVTDIPDGFESEYEWNN